MKNITKKITVAAVIIATTATLAYAGMNLERNRSVRNVFDHPALEQLATYYSLQR